MRKRIGRVVLVAVLVVPAMASAMDCGNLRCEGISGGLWPFGRMAAWCNVVRAALCAIGY
jgi:hypothetical protein